MNQKTYRVDIMGQSEPTYIVESDVVKLVKHANTGARLILVGRSFINPASISRIQRAYDVDAMVEPTDQELIKQIEGSGLKQLE